MKNTADYQLSSLQDQMIGIDFEVFEHFSNVIWLSPNDCIISEPTISCIKVHIWHVMMFLKHWDFLNIKVIS